MIHNFPENTVFEPEWGFTDPFRYKPHPLVKSAAAEVMSRISRDVLLSEAFAEGKMLGVLVCRRQTSICYIAAFSGNVAGKSKIEGFVPPIYDLCDPDGNFKKMEAQISAINRRLGHLVGSQEYAGLNEELAAAQRDRDEQLGLLRAGMAVAKKEREQIRAYCDDTATLKRLAGESQFEKAELRRLKLSWEERIEELKARVHIMEEDIDKMKKLRASMSEELQDWIFRQYIVHDSLGNSSSIAGIFAASDLTPPGGTGECAAPKLLEYAYRHALQPLAMGEFWYGRSPDTAVRTHGHFYPSCTSKCGPLLKYMMQGLPHTRETATVCPENPFILYKDQDIIIVEKPGGMPSVPGLDGRTSALEWLQEQHPEAQAVHRLDMDTSGIMVFATSDAAAVNLRRQFEQHTVRKTYRARLSYSPDKVNRHDRGSITLPLSPDYDERPRQKVDFRQGKSSHTDYSIISENPDGTADILLAPITGRTHQLRVHCAHALGLSCPIEGDLLYGGYAVESDKGSSADGYERLCLHAAEITFRHPSTGEELTFSSSKHIYR